MKRTIPAAFAVPMYMYKTTLITVSIYKRVCVCALLCVFHGTDLCVAICMPIYIYMHSICVYIYLYIHIILLCKVYDYEDPSQERHASP